VDVEGKYIRFTNLQIASQWQFLTDLEGVLDRMRIKETITYDHEIVYSLEGAWSKLLPDNTTHFGCRFDANGDAYFTTWTVSPSWENPGKWIVSGNELTVKSAEGDVILTCNFLVDVEGKYIRFTNLQIASQWQFLTDLEGVLDRMRIKETILD
jgi:hypothetical protein